MSYREAPANLPLVVALGSLLVAVEPETGRELWRQELGSVVTRFFLVEQRIFVASGKELSCLDLTSGKNLGKVAIGFAIRAGFVRDQRLYVSGIGGAGVVTLEGNVLWKCTPEHVPTFTISEGDAYDINTTATNHIGEKLWTAELSGKHSQNQTNGILLGECVAQPDL